MRFLASSDVEPGFYPAAAFLALVLLIGGTSVGHPLLDMTVQLGGLALLGYQLWDGGRLARDGIGRALLILAALAAATPLVQLLPLPPAVWTALPGRADLPRVYGLVGLQAGYRPLSLAPDNTLQDLLSLLPGIALLVATLRLGREARYRLVAVVLVIALASALLGTLQLATRGADSVMFYATSHQGRPIGFFTNRNHQADFLQIGMLAAATLNARGPARSGWTPGLPFTLGLIALFAVATISNTSRMGLLLLPFSALVSLLLVLKPPKGYGRLASGIVAGIVTLLAAAGVLFSGNAVVHLTLVRFGDFDDVRFGFWPDVIYTVRSYFPFGSGLGTFDPIYRSAEVLGKVGPAFLNHAHNDYLELLLEVGAWAAVMFFAFLIVLAAAGRQAWKSSRVAPQSSAWFALAAITVLLAHSIVDYPLRTAALSGLLGLLCGLLAEPPPARPVARRGRRGAGIGVRDPGAAAHPADRHRHRR